MTKYTVRFDNFINKIVMEDEKGNRKATFPAEDAALATKCVNALNAKGLDVA